MQSLLLHTSSLFTMLLIDDIVDIEKPDAICLPTFIVDEFSVLFFYVHQSFLLSIQDLHK